MENKDTQKIIDIVLNNFLDKNYDHVKALYKEATEGYLCMPVFVVYEHPKDFPGKYVVRLWQIDRENNITEPTSYCVVKDTLKEIREALPCNLYRFGRDSSDDPVIIETWI